MSQVHRRRNSRRSRKGRCHSKHVSTNNGATVATSYQNGPFSRFISARSTQRHPSSERPTEGRHGLVMRTCPGRSICQDEDVGVNDTNPGILRRNEVHLCECRCQLVRYRGSSHAKSQWWEAEACSILFENFDPLPLPSSGTHK